jgi:hypothetical protein
MPAMRCDLDHRVPFDHEAAKEGRPQPGPTVRSNLGPLCRRHHRIKTLGLWTLTGDAAEVSRWTSPCGLSYEQHPEPLLVPDPFNDHSGRDDDTDHDDRQPDRRANGDPERSEPDHAVAGVPT